MLRLNAAPLCVAHHVEEWGVSQNHEQRLFWVRQWEVQLERFRRKSIPNCKRGSHAGSIGWTRYSEGMPRVRIPPRIS